MISVKQTDMGHKNVVFHREDFFGIKIKLHQFSGGIYPYKN